MQSCRKLTGPATNFGETWQRLMDAIDLLNECSHRHESLIKYENERK